MGMLSCKAVDNPVEHNKKLEENDESSMVEASTNDWLAN
jgi:hypothetical protein